MSLVKTRGGELIILGVIVVLSYLAVRLSVKKPPKIRRLAAIDGMEEAVGRATETNKPIVWYTGTFAQSGYLMGAYAPTMVATMSCLTYVAGLVAKYGAELTVITMSVEMEAMIRQLIENQYKLAGKEKEFNPGMVQAIPDQGSSWLATIENLIGRKASANLMIGAAGGEAVLLSDIGHSVGAIQIGGTSGERTTNIACYAVLCDYLLIFEEELAAGAYISQDPLQMGTVQGEDWGRFLAATLIILGVIFLNVGSRLMIDFLKF